MAGNFQVMKGTNIQVQELETCEKNNKQKQICDNTRPKQNKYFKTGSFQHLTPR